MTPPPSRAASCHGFTLLECLVALAVLAIALTAALAAVSNTIRNTERLREHTLAAWVAHNHMAELRSKGAFPNLGIVEGQTEQGGVQWLWQQHTKATPNAMFRRVDVTVSRAGSEETLTRVTGFVCRPLR